jgi:hypothetical protein
MVGWLIRVALARVLKGIALKDESGQTGDSFIANPGEGDNFVED